jgi:anti-sigma regulatory factor (Ser/Thr protein kinase)
MNGTTVSGNGNGAFVHDALFYAGEREFLDGTVSFIRAGVDAGEPTLVVVSAAKIAKLRGALDGDAGQVLFADMAAVGTNPARIIPAWRRFVDQHAGGGRPLRGIGEPIWPERSAHELVECQRHESLLNLAFADAPPFRLLCPYDVEALDESVIEEARCSHPAVVDNGTRLDSVSFCGLDAIAEPFDRPLPEPPESAEVLEIDERSVASIRRHVRLRAAAADLSAARTHYLVLAVHEIATNSVRHGGGIGVLQIWQEEGSLICEIRDGGKISDPLVGRRFPDAEGEGGRGIWIANQVCDLVQVRTFEGGNAIRLHMRPG